MRKYFYNYQTIIRFSQPVSRHCFLLRCVPGDNDFQKIVEKQLYLNPYDYLNYGVDGFGNPVQWGSRMAGHDSFVFVSCGEVWQETYRIGEELSGGGIWRVPSALTGNCKEMKELLSGACGKGLDRALYLSHMVHDFMEYVPGSTSATTTAVEALGQRHGVCQDFAHILLSLCRLEGMAARYVNGFMTGEGQTHAWVEVYDGWAWHGVDPTNDCLIDYGYIKLSHGRDASDCPVNRGAFLGAAAQQVEIRVIVEEL